MALWSSLRLLFKRRPVVGYRVYLDPRGKHELVGEYRCSANEALQQAQMELLREFFESGREDAVTLNLVAEPIYGKKE